MSAPISSLSGAIKSALEASYAETAESQQGQFQSISDALAAAIDAHIKSHKGTGTDSGGDSHNLSIT